MSIKYKSVLVVCLAVMLSAVMLMPVTASASSKAKKVKFWKTEGSSEQLVVKGLNRHNKVVWRYVSDKYPATELAMTKCIVRGKKVYIFDGSALRILSKATGRRMHVVSEITPAGHAAGFDAHGNIYVTGYYDTVLYKISPKGRILWKSDYQSKGKYWAYKIKVIPTRVIVVCDADDSNPGEQGPYYLVFSTENGDIAS